MNDEIKKIYKQVCLNQNLPTTIKHNNAYMLDRFADEFAYMIIAYEREACAQIADKHTKASFMGAVGAEIRARGAA